MVLVILYTMDTLMVLVNLYTMDTLMALVNLYTMDTMMVLVNLYTMDTMMVLVNLYTLGYPGGFIQCTFFQKQVLKMNSRLRRRRLTKSLYIE